MLTQENMVMPVAPTGAGGFGGMGDNGWWIILLFILLGGFGNYGNRGGNTGAEIQRGFDQAALTSGLGDLSTAVCQGFAGVNQGVANGFAQAEIAANARQLSNIQVQNALQAQLANCCCENRLATANLQSTILSENCADRAAVSDALRDVIVNQNANTQRILDQMCNDKIDAKNDLIAQLRQELLFARGQASQDVQTADLRANNATVANQLLAEMRSCPIPAQPVYGSQPIFTCNGNTCGCNCGCGVG